MSTLPTPADQYLDDLARMLSGIEGAERAEVLGSVREHIDSALAELDQSPTENDVVTVLNALGAPSEVAAHALEPQGSETPVQSSSASAGMDRFASLTPGTSAPVGRSTALTAAWVPPLAVLSILGGSLFGFALVPLLLLIGGIVLVCGSPLWRVPQKVLSCVVAPVCLLPAWLMGLNLWLLGGADSLGITVARVLPPAVGLVGIGILAWVWIIGAGQVKRRESAAGHPPR